MFTVSRLCDASNCMFRNLKHLGMKPDQIPYSCQKLVLLIFGKFYSKVVLLRALYVADIYAKLWDE